MSEPAYLTQRVISLKALQRSRTTLEDFAQTYLPLHGLPPESLFQWLDLFVYVEALIYQMDEDNEETCTAMTDPRDTQEGARACVLETQQTGMQCIELYLKERGYWDDQIAHHLAQGMAYWQEEQQLCKAMASRTTSLLTDDRDNDDTTSNTETIHHRHNNTQGPPTTTLTMDRVLSAHEKKSFDYRLLHCLLHRVLQKPYDMQLMEFLLVDERLVDIGDDLTDLEDDVAANSFNIYRAFLHMFGRDADLQLVQRIGVLEREHKALLEGLPEATQEAYRARQRSDAHAPGAERWVIPSPIWDEHGFRARLATLQAT